MYGTVTRRAPIQFAQKSNYGTAPSAVPSDATKLLALELRGTSGPTCARLGYVLLESAGSVTVGAAGPLWLCRYSIGKAKWIACARLLGGASFALTATLWWEEPVGEVIPDSDAFDLWDQGGGALGANVTLHVGWFE